MQYRRTLFSVMNTYGMVVTDPELIARLSS